MCKQTGLLWIRNLCIPSPKHQGSHLASPLSKPTHLSSSNVKGNEIPQNRISPSSFPGRAHWPEPSFCSLSPFLLRTGPSHEERDNSKPSLTLLRPEGVEGWRGGIPNKKEGYIKGNSNTVQSVCSKSPAFLQSFLPLGVGAMIYFLSHRTRERGEGAQKEWSGKDTCLQR